MISPNEIYLNASSQNSDYVSTKGSEFSINYTPALRIPLSAKNVTLAVIRASIWWTIPNISVATSILINFGPRLVPILPEQKTEMEVPKGLYTVTELNTLLQRHCVTRGRAGEIQIIGNSATNKIVILITTLNTSITIPESLKTILGFPGGTVLTNLSGTSEVTEAPNVAGFDTLQYLNISTDLVDGGIMSGNGRYNGCIAQVNLDAAPGYQILYQPVQPLEIQTSVFQNSQGVSTGRFVLMDQDMNPVDTNQQSWSILLRLRYYL